DPVQDAFRELLAGGVQDGGGGHQVPDVPDEHERTSVDAHLARSVGGGEDAVVVQLAGDGLAALDQFFREVAAVESEPVAVTEDLVVGVHRGDRVLEVHDRRDRGLQHDVLDTGGIGGADGGVGIDLDVDVQPVVEQQHVGRSGGVSEETLELGRIREAAGGATVQRHAELTVDDRVPGRVRVRAGRQGNRG